MSKQPPKTTRSHKRQKSSLLNISYYFPENQQPNPSASAATSGGSTASGSAPPPPSHKQIDDNIYDNEYNLDYNFPPNPGQPPHSSHSSLLGPPSHMPPVAPPSGGASNTQYRHSPLKRPSSVVGLPESNAYSEPSNPITQPSSTSSSLFYPSHIQNPIYNASEPPYPSFNPNTSLTESTYYQSFNYPRIPSNPSSQSMYDKQSIKHAKNNLSISSHFNLFNINDPNSSSGLGSASTSSSFNTSLASAQPPTASPILIPDSKKFSSTFPNLPIPTQQSTNNIINDLIVNLVSVDGSNINNYLLTIIYKLNFPIPVDDFYNLLYNNGKSPFFNLNKKIDKTVINTSIPNSSVDIINQLLNVFKNPNLMGNFFPSLIDKENKLMNINYHELLRTFLAIKILFDILIQLPMNSPDEPQNFTIPRLSIYKTYYIICQKLILQYPSSSNSTNEQQKLILGQSKLGKLIKLVYPNLLIKRLGSRGESKYNYLGVVWNENIIHDDIKELCDQNEIHDLNEFFNVRRKQQQQQQLLQFQYQQNPQQSQILQQYHLPQLQAVPQSITQQYFGHKQHKRRPSKNIRQFEESDSKQESIVSPELSYIHPSSKFPTADDFTILAISSGENHSSNSWFDNVKMNCYSKLQNYNINYSVISTIFLNNDNLLQKDSLLKNIITNIVQPIISFPVNEDIDQDQNIDLNLYAIIIIELLPYLLLLRSSTETNFLKNLRLNLLYLISNLNSEVSNIENNNIFTIKNSTVFLMVVKKLINLNDLLITFIKLIIKEDSISKSAMATDIENFFVDSTEDIKRPYDNSRNSSISDDILGRSSSISSSSATLTSGRLDDEYQDSFGLNFKSILSNDLIYSLIGYNFDPTLNDELKSSISMSFVNQEINIIDNFFKNDLLAFLTEETDSNSTASLGSEDSHKEESLILSEKEARKLNSLINLIDTKLLSEKFKTKYPILIYNSYINFILNDLLKYIFLKQQQQQQQLQQLQQQLQLSQAATQPNKNSFGNWWVFHSFILEYLSLLGEIVGLNDLL